MRRFSVLLTSLVVALLGIGSILATSALSAQAPDEPHPLVGSWWLDTDSEDPEGAPELAIATADGSWIEADPGAGISLGVWEATGPQSAILTFWSVGADEEGGFYGTFVLRASIEVAADGQSFTATYTGEFIAPDGSTAGEYGPGTASATRLAAEPMGTPVGPFDELFAQFEGTPEASPAP